MRAVATISRARANKHSSNFCLTILQPFGNCSTIHQPLQIALLQLDTVNIKWDHFEILATGRSDIHCRIKESLLIKDLKPSLNENVGSEKLFLY